MTEPEQLYRLTDWTLYDLSDEHGPWRYLRGTPVGNPRIKGREIMTRNIISLEDGVAHCEGGVSWILGEAKA